MLATSLNSFVFLSNCPAHVDSQSTSASSSDYSYIGWIAGVIAGGLVLLAIGICAIVAIILIRKRLKQRGRVWQFLQNTLPNDTHQQDPPAGSMSGLEAIAYPMSSTQEEMPPSFEEDREEEEDNHCDNDANGMKSLLTESGDEQPLLPN